MSSVYLKRDGPKVNVVSFVLTSVYYFYSDLAVFPQCEPDSF